MLVMTVFSQCESHMCAFLYILGPQEKKMPEPRNMIKKIIIKRRKDSTVSHKLTCNRNMHSLNTSNTHRWQGDSESNELFWYAGHPNQGRQWATSMNSLYPTNTSTNRDPSDSLLRWAQVKWAVNCVIVRLINCLYSKLQTSFFSFTTVYRGKQHVPES